VSTAYVPGNDSTFHFVVVVEGAKVRAFWTHATFEAN
jgi:hypothetical protein